MSGKDFSIGHEPDRDALRERIAELEATVRVLRENEEKLHTAHSVTINEMVRLGGHKAVLLGVIADAVEEMDEACEMGLWYRIDGLSDDLNDALRRYGA